MTEVGIYKGKQECKKIRKQELDSESDEEKRKQEFDQESDQEKNKKNLIFFLITLSWSSFCFLVFFYKFRPQKSERS